MTTLLAQLKSIPPAHTPHSEGTGFGTEQVSPTRGVHMLAFNAALREARSQVSPLYQTAGKWSFMYRTAPDKWHDTIPTFLGSARTMRAYVVARATADILGLPAPTGPHALKQVWEAYRQHHAV